MFSIIKQTNSEHIKFCVEKRSNFKAIIAINSTALGPALGDITFIPDDTNYREATSCACFLSQKLTAVYAFLGLHYGGGKIIAQGKPTPGLEEVYFRSLARHVEKLNGRFIIRSSSYINEKLLEYISVETGNLLQRSIAVNREPVLSKIKQCAVMNSLREISTKSFANSELSKLKIGFFGTDEEFKRVSWLVEILPSLRPSQAMEGPIDILLVSATGANSSRMQDMFKYEFKFAMGIFEEEIDMEVYENVMWAKGINYIPGYLVENLECFFFSRNNVDLISCGKVDLSPFEMFVREKLAYLFDRSAEKKIKITGIIDEFANSRIEMLQLLK